MYTVKCFHQLTNQILFTKYSKYLTTAHNWTTQTTDEQAKARIKSNSTLHPQEVCVVFISVEVKRLYYLSDAIHKTGYTGKYNSIIPSFNFFPIKMT